VLRGENQKRKREENNVGGFCLSKGSVLSLRYGEKRLPWVVYL